MLTLPPAKDMRLPFPVLLQNTLVNFVAMAISISREKNCRYHQSTSLRTLPVEYRNQMHRQNEL